MGFHTTELLADCPALTPGRTKTPSKNRVWNFFETSQTRARLSASQPVELHQTTWDTSTKTVSGRANGNISDYVTTNGTVVAHYEYDPYGNTIAKSGTMADTFNFRFSTKYLDAETGLYYYGYRYYQPSTGRWPSRDPIGERGGLLLYGFVRNEPVGRWDKLGLDFRVYRTFTVVWPGSSQIVMGSSKFEMIPYSVRTGRWENRIVTLDVVFQWSASIFDFLHEEAHLKDAYKYFYQPLEKYMESKKGPYCTKQEAQCWCEAAANFAPWKYYYEEAVITISTTDYNQWFSDWSQYMPQLAAAKEALADLSGQLQKKEAACEALGKTLSGKK